MEIKDSETKKTLNRMSNTVTKLHEGIKKKSKKVVQEVKPEEEEEHEDDENEEESFEIQSRKKVNKKTRGKAKGRQ